MTTDMTTERCGQGYSERKWGGLVKKRGFQVQ